jgi:hypothetical protein
MNTCQIKSQKKKHLKAKGEKKETEQEQEEKKKKRKTAQRYITHTSSYVAHVS